MLFYFRSEGVCPLSMGLRMPFDSDSNLTTPKRDKPSVSKSPKLDCDHFVHMGRMFLAEMLGLGVICFTIVLYQPGKRCVLPVSLLVGAVFGWVAWVIGPISGAQVNPAVSLSMLMTRRLSFVYTLVYIVAQLVGAMAGAWLGKICGPLSIATDDDVGMTFRNPAVSIGQAVGLEILGTCILITVILSTHDEFRAKHWSHGHMSAFPFMFGLTLSLLCAILSIHSGGSMNPALSLGIAVANNNFTEQWIYVVGPLAGAVNATLVFEIILSDGAYRERIKAWFTDPHFDRTKEYRVDPFIETMVSTDTSYGHP
ncbi:hypothetical protein AHF37_00195 [Paragonimus kellicotti]|nr:hypothetical protein AHF37_00195 [Paragonimus kellicotti]